MVKETMIELLLINRILDFKTWYDAEVFKSKYDINKLIERKKLLEDKFLSDYVIDSDSKE